MGRTDAFKASPCSIVAQNCSSQGCLRCREGHILLFFLVRVDTPAAVSMVALAVHLTVCVCVCKLGRNIGTFHMSVCMGQLQSGFLMGTALI